MALRQLGRVFRSLVAAPPPQQAFAAQQALRSFGAAAHHAEDDHSHEDEEHGPVVTPTVFDKIVTLNVVDMQGHRHAVKGYVGKSLSQALIEHGFPEVRYLIIRQELHVLAVSSIRYNSLATVTYVGSVNTHLFPPQTFFFPRLSFYSQHIGK